MNALLFLAVRAAHVLVAGLWIGSTVFGAFWLMPAIEASGPSGGQVMARLTRGGYATYMSVIGLTTLVTGIFLLWRFTGGFDPAVAATHAGMAFGTGGACGILAGIIGGAIVGRSAKRLAEVMGPAAQAEQGPARRALAEQAIALRRRMKIGTQFVIGFQLIALISMAIGHYV
jgi:hypothetical protein